MSQLCHATDAAFDPAATSHVWHVDALTVLYLIGSFIYVRSSLRDTCDHVLTAADLRGMTATDVIGAYIDQPVKSVYTDKPITCVPRQLLEHHLNHRTVPFGRDNELFDPPERGWYFYYQPPDLAKNCAWITSRLAVELDDFGSITGLTVG